MWLRVPGLRWEVCAQDLPYNADPFVINICEVFFQQRAELNMFNM